MTRSQRRTTLACAVALGGTLLLWGASTSGAEIDTASAQPQEFAEWSWPIAPPHAFVRAFVAPATPYSAGHRGVDLELSSGAQVFAPADGIVHFAGRIAGRDVISLAHAGDLLSSYEAVSSELSQGDVVEEGDLIGVLSDGGHCNAECLHFGVRLHGEYVSPMLLLGGVPRAVLLPLG